MVNDLVYIDDGRRCIRVPVTPSLNQWQRMHWARRKQVKDDYVKVLRFVSVWLHEERSRLGPARHIEIIRHSPCELDYDNLVGGAKPLVDALVWTSIIADDDPGNVTIKYMQTKAKRIDMANVVRLY